jgi:hypothetical protein
MYGTSLKFGGGIDWRPCCFSKIPVSLGTQTVLGYIYVLGFHLEVLHWKGDIFYEWMSKEQGVLTLMDSTGRFLFSNFLAHTYLAILPPNLLFISAL